MPGEYVVSAPAKHAAHVMLMHFEIHEVADGKTAPTESNLAKLIDLYTKSYKIKPALNAIAKELDHTRPGEMERNFDRLREACRLLEMFDEDAPHWEEDAQLIHAETGSFSPVTGAERKRAAAMGRAYQISATSVIAVRKLAERFDFIERKGGKITCSEKNLAIIIDISTNIWRVMDAIHHAASLTRGMSEADMFRNMAALRKVFEEIDLARTAMPSGTAPMLPGKDFGKVDIGAGLSHDRKINLAKVTRALENAKTADEQRNLLIAATKDKLL